jgi:twitching motility protein PilT
MDVSKFFHMMVERGSSDLFLRGMACPRARVDGKLQVLSEDILSLEDMRVIVEQLLVDEQRKKEYDENQGVDFIHEVKGLGRFRVNIFIQRGTPALVARYVHTQARTFDELKLPGQVCKLFCEERKGLFLVCGPAGNGKSTTIASMIEYINVHSSQHIITIEDPIEFLFKDKKSLINQRELGIDVFSYPYALRDVTQQSPDIIFIGNIRDEATMRAAITATELGTFVMTTFHTINALQTIVRIVNFFPPYLHDEIRMQLSLILRGTISLRLLPRKDGKGRIPAFETMVVTPTIARLIREGNIRDIQNYIDDGDLFGMQSFKQSLVGLVKNDLVDADVARQHADSKDDFDLALKGIQ